MHDYKAGSSGER
jgi:hypothetical protein